MDYRSNKYESIRSINNGVADYWGIRRNYQGTWEKIKIKNTIVDHDRRLNGETCDKEILE